MLSAQQIFYLCSSTLRRKVHHRSHALPPSKHSALVSSRHWQKLFLEKKAALAEFPWEDEYRLSEEEIKRITHSIQQFELGENAQGRHFLRCAKNFAEKTGDLFLPSAIQAFIEEEQRHSGFLRRFMLKQDIPVLEKHWVDNTFRQLRKLAGLQTCVMVLLTAEIIALPYYRGLFNATKSPLLKRICRQILRDEADHLVFQANTLRKIRALEPSALVGLQEALHYFLMLATSVLVWRQHQQVISCASYEFFSFARTNFRTLAALHKLARRPMPSDAFAEDKFRAGVSNI